MPTFLFCCCFVSFVIMVKIYHNLEEAARKYNQEGNYVVGANIAGFEKVAEAMKAQGIV